MTAYNARKLVGLVGRGAARVFYVVFGGLFIAGAIQMVVRSLASEPDKGEPAEVESTTDPSTSTGPRILGS